MFVTTLCFFQGKLGFFNWLGWRKKTPDQTASELEQQRNVLAFLFPSLEMEVRAALGFVEIPLCIVTRWRKWFRVQLLVLALGAGLVSTGGADAAAHAGCPWQWWCGCRWCRTQRRGRSPADPAHGADTSHGCRGEPRPPAPFQGFFLMARGLGK